MSKKHKRRIEWSNSGDTAYEQMQLADDIDAIINGELPFDALKNDEHVVNGDISQDIYNAISQVCEENDGIETETVYSENYNTTGTIQEAEMDELDDIISRYDDESESVEDFENIDTEYVEDEDEDDDSKVFIPIDEDPDIEYEDDYDEVIDEDEDIKDDEEEVIEDEEAASDEIKEDEPEIQKEVSSDIDTVRIMTICDSENYLKTFRKIRINDDIIPVFTDVDLAFYMADTYNFVSDYKDLQRYIDIFYPYIVCRRVPTAIFKENEFKAAFSNVKTLKKKEVDDVLFFQNEEYISVYVVDKNFINDVNSFIDLAKINATDDLDNIVCIWYAMAKASSDKMSSIQIYPKGLKNIYRSKLNNKDFVIEYLTKNQDEDSDEYIWGDEEIMDYHEIIELGDEMIAQFEDTSKDDEEDGVMPKAEEEEETSITKDDIEEEADDADIRNDLFDALTREEDETESEPLPELTKLKTKETPNNILPVVRRN